MYTQIGIISISIILVVFSTGRMLVLENDFESIAVGVESMPKFSFLFALVMTLSMLTVGMVALSYTGYRALCKIQLGFLKKFTWKKKVFIFSELNESALLLGTDIKLQHKDGIVIYCVPGIEEEEEQLELEKEAAQKGFFVIPMQNELHRELFSLCKHFSKKKLYLFFISKDEIDNISACSDFSEFCKTKKNHLPRINTYLWVQGSDYASMLSAQEYSSMELHIIDENELAVRNLFSEITPNAYGDDDYLKIYILGWNKIAENLIKYLVSLGQVQNRRLKIVLLEENIVDKSAIFFNQNVQIGQVSDFVFIEKIENSKDYFDYLNQEFPNIDMLFYLNQDLRSLAELFRIKTRLASEAKLCCYFSNKNQYKELLGKTDFFQIQFFGNWKELYTDALIIDEKLDVLAKGFHQYYGKLYEDTRKWEDISLFEQQSNRALALSIQSKLYGIGLYYDIGDSVELFESKIKDTKILMKLTIEEHIRWNAFYFCNGWRTLTVDKNNLKNKNAKTKEHVCLVSFDELVTVGEAFEKDFQEMDQHLVLHMGKILQQAGFGVYAR